MATTLAPTEIKPSAIFIERLPFALVSPLLFSLISSATLATPVLAAGPKQQTISRTHGNGAFSSWRGPIGQFSNIFLDVVKSNAGTDIVLFVDTPTCISCCAELTTTANVFQINGLNSATLSPVTLNVCIGFDEFFNCNQTVPVTIQETWTAFGATTASFPGQERITGPPGTHYRPPKYSTPPQVSFDSIFPLFPTHLVELLSHPLFQK